MFSKETYNFKEITNRSHPIARSFAAKMAEGVSERGKEKEHKKTHKHAHIHTHAYTHTHKHKHTHTHTNAHAHIHTHYRQTKRIEFFICSPMKVCFDFAV